MSTNNDEFQCGCPSCRMGRGELTPNEYAWYLKGKIEARAQDLLLKEKGKFGEFDPEQGIVFRSYESALKSDLMDDECVLDMMVKDVIFNKHDFSSKHRLEKVDPAFLTPRDYICEACVKHGKRLPNNVQDSG